MDKVKAMIRPTDILLAVALSALGVLLMHEDMTGSGGSTRIDSTSWTLIPVFLVATVPVLLRRVNLLAVILVSAAALAAHDAIFGWVVRCGAGLPLAFVLAYSAGRLLADRRHSLIALVLTIGVQALTLVRDSAAGPSILPVTAVIGIACWGAGLFVTSYLSKPASTAAVPAVPVAPAPQPLPAESRV